MFQNLSHQEGGKERRRKNKREEEEEDELREKITHLSVVMQNNKRNYICFSIRLHVAKAVKVKKKIKTSRDRIKRNSV